MPARWLVLQGGNGNGVAAVPTSSFTQTQARNNRLVFLFTCCSASTFRQTSHSFEVRLFDKLSASAAHTTRPLRHTDPVHAAWRHVYKQKGSWIRLEWPSKPHNGWRALHAKNALLHGHSDTNTHIQTAKHTWALVNTAEHPHKTSIRSDSRVFIALSSSQCTKRSSISFMNSTEPQDSYQVSSLV